MLDAHRERSLDQPLLEMMQVSFLLLCLSFLLLRCLFEFCTTFHFIGEAKGRILRHQIWKIFLYVLQNKCESKIWYGHLIEFSLQIKMRYHISVLLTPVCVVLNCLWLHYWPLHVNPPWDPSHQNLPFLSWAIIKLQLSSLDFNLNS